jgi:hypothetical protein
MTKMEIIQDIMTQGGEREVNPELAKPMIQRAVRKPKEYLESVHRVYIKDKENHKFYFALLFM